MKRLTDYLGSFCGVLLLSPIMLLVALIIWLQRDGPIVFAQVRVGINQEPFICYKFRTMSVSAPEVATHQLEPSQITRLGQLLRRYKLDELPQLFNVLGGDMSLVGPRPCLPTQKELISKRAMYDIFSIKPGITGLAQIQNVDMRDPEKLVKIEKNYLDQHSFWGDLAIIWKTIFKQR